MFRRIFAANGLMPVALLGFLLVPGPAAAQQGEHLYEWSGGWGRSPAGFSYGGGYGASYYEAPSYYSSYYEAPGYYYPTPAGTDYGYFSPSGAGNGSAVNRAVLINVSVPADAEIWFDNTKTTQSGAFRHFVSPPLTSGHDYFYEVKARWTEDGKEVTRSRRVAVHAGDVINVSFNSGAVVSRIP